MNYQDPLFSTYAISACLMILKAMGQGWITVYRMLKVKAGFRSPEDNNKGLCNPNPSGDQTILNEYVDRSRRIHSNDGENIPYFLVVGLLFIFTSPSLWLAKTLLYGFVISRFCHFLAYMTARSHEVRATFYTIGSCKVIGMAAYCIYYAVTL